MSEIDPWAMPRTASVNPGSVGLPGSIHAPVQRVRPLDRRPARVVSGLGVLYVIVCIAEIFYIDHAKSLATQLNTMIETNQFPSLAQSAQLQSDDNATGTVSWVALAVLLATLVAIAAWQRVLTDTLGSVGARRAVFRRAGYAYFRIALVVSLLLSLFLQATTAGGNVNTYQDVVNHDDMYMLYFAVRAVAGAFVVYFANRLARVANEGVGLLNGTSVPY